MVTKTVERKLDIQALPVDCRCAYSALVQGKGDKYKCSKSRGISLLSAVGKLNGRLLIRRVRDGSWNCVCNS